MTTPQYVKELVAYYNENARVSRKIKAFEIEWNWQYGYAELLTQHGRQEPCSPRTSKELLDQSSRHLIMLNQLAEICAYLEDRGKIVKRPN